MGNEHHSGVAKVSDFPLLYVIRESKNPNIASCLALLGLHPSLLQPFSTIWLLLVGAVNLYFDPLTILYTERPRTNTLLQQLVNFLERLPQRLTRFLTDYLDITYMTA